MKKLVIAVFCTIFAALTEADTWTDKNGLVWNYSLRSDDTVEIIKNPNGGASIPNDTKGELIIPSTINGRKVTVIGANALSSCKDLTSIVIPDNVVRIASSGFNFCSNMKALRLPKTLEVLETHAFAHCYNLRAVVIPGSLRSSSTFVFHECGQLREVIIEEGVTQLSGHMFTFCNAIKYIVFPSTMLAIGDRCFQGASIGEAYFYGAPPSGLGGVPTSKIYFSKKSGQQWMAEADSKKLQGYIDVLPFAEVEAFAEMVSPTQMKVSYVVNFPNLPKGRVAPQNVNVRAVAFKDGIRSFANIVPVIANGTVSKDQSVGLVPNGNSVPVGTKQSFVWDIAKDWATNDVKLGRVCLEILVQEDGNLLPRELITIPAVKATEEVAEHPETIITRNVVPESLQFNALLWCYAEDKQGNFNRLTVDNGNLKYNEQTLASGRTVTTEALSYLYERDGFQILSGETLDWAREATRLGFVGENLQQRAVKVNQPTTPTVKE